MCQCPNGAMARQAYGGLASHGTGAKTVLVTGGAAGIGVAVARYFVAQGDAVLTLDTASPVRDNADKSPISIVGDISVRGVAEHAVDIALSRFGGLDILVNCAAVFATLEPQPFEAIDPDEWRRVFDVNVLGMVACCRAAVAALRESRGRIVNLASTAVMEGAPGFAHYVASKGAIIALTRSLARELGCDGVTVNAVAPGLTLSEHLAARGFGASDGAAMVRARRSVPRDQFPADIVGAIAFLASDAAAMVTGQTIVVDGGGVFV